MSEKISEIRNSDVVNAYFDSMKSIKKESPYSSQEDVISDALQKGAPRFYTTYENARRFVSLIARGKRLPLVNENKVEMYNELFRRFLCKKNNNCGYLILEQIIEEEAPSFYLDFETFRGIIYKTLNKK